MCTKLEFECTKSKLNDATCLSLSGQFGYHSQVLIRFSIWTLFPSSHLQFLLFLERCQIFATISLNFANFRRLQSTKMWILYASNGSLCKKPLLPCKCQHTVVFGFFPQIGYSNKYFKHGLWCWKGSKNKNKLPEIGAMMNNNEKNYETKHRKA